MFVWLIIGHIWHSQEPDTSPCRTGEHSGTLMSSHSFTMALMWVFLIGGFLIGFFTICVHACEEGSCTGWDTCRFFLLCCTCGLCDIGKKTRKGREVSQRSHYRYSENKKAYSDVRKQWIAKALNLVSSFGFVSKPVTQQGQHTQRQNHSNPGFIDIKDYDQVNQGQTIELRNLPSQRNNLNIPNQMVMTYQPQTNYMISGYQQPLYMTANYPALINYANQSNTKMNHQINHIPVIKSFSQVRLIVFN